MNIKAIFCSALLVIIFGNSVVMSLVPQDCAVSLDIHNENLNKPQDECFTFSCMADYNDGDPDAIEIRDSTEFIYYDVQSFQTHRFYSNKVVVNASTFKNNFIVKYVPTLSWGSLTFTCRCGSSTSSATVNVMDNGFGESSEVTATVTVTKKTGIETKATLNQTAACLSNTMPAQMFITECYKKIVFAVTKPTRALGYLKLVGLNKASGDECDLNASRTVTGTVATFTVADTVNCTGSSGSADDSVFYIRLCSTTTNYCRTIGTVRTLGCAVMEDTASYRLTFTHNKLALGESLSITAELIDPKTPVGDVKITLLPTGSTTWISIFDDRVAGCRLLGSPYTSGTINLCDKTNHRYIVTLPSITSDHIGQYRIEAPLQSPRYSDSLAVELVVKPTSVVVTPSPLTAVEGQTKTLVCTVDNDAATPVTFEWTRIQNGNQVAPPAGTTVVTQPGGRQSHLSWTSISRQDTGQYECQASNKAGSLTSSPADVTVYYPADSVTLTTSATTVSTGTSVTLTCTSSGGNPRPGLVIYDVIAPNTALSQSFQSGLASLTFTKVMQKINNGVKYQCKTSVGVSAGPVDVTTSNIVTVNVQFRPSGITAPSSVDVDEYQTKVISCETTSSSNPATQLLWSGPALGDVESSTEIVDHGVKSTINATITGQRDINGGEYTCKGTYLSQQLAPLVTTLNVNFAPNSIAFYDTADSVLEGESQVMKCRADNSRPAGTVTWSKLNSGVTFQVNTEAPTQVPDEYGGTVLESQITIIANRRDNGTRYWCEVEYTYSNGTNVRRRATPKTLNVYYRVDVSITVSSGADIREGDPVTLTCATSGGNPQTINAYQWKYNDQVIEGASGRTLSRHPIHYDQGGRYRCSATNAAGTSSAETTIDVEFKPRLDPSVSHLTIIGAALGGYAKFTLTMLANPTHTGAEWTKNGTDFGQRFTLSNHSMTYTLHITDIEQQDYGSYRCRITNAVGSTTFTFTLNPESPPETPTGLRLTGRSASSVTLIWTSGFSGANSQRFILELEYATHQWQILEVPDPGIGLTVEYTVEKLVAGSQYRVRIRSLNNKGKYSDYTPEITASTKVSFTLLGPDLVIKRENNVVIVEWTVTDRMVRDYRDSVITVVYTIETAPPGGDETATNSVRGKFVAGSLRFNVSQGYKYIYDVLVHDSNRLMMVRRSLTIGEETTPSPPPTDDDTLVWALRASVGVVIILLVIVIVILIVKVIIYYRKWKSCRPNHDDNSPVISGSTSQDEGGVEMSRRGHDDTYASRGIRASVEYEDMFL